MSTLSTTPPCIKCTHCKPYGTQWVCCKYYPDVVSEPYNTFGECKKFMYRSTNLDNCIDESEYYYEETIQ